MGNCKDCKYWSDGLCDLPEWVSENENVGENGFGIYANALDDSGLTAELKTGPMFGCVKFKNK